jgi:chromosomal replication initiator protein
MSKPFPNCVDKPVESGGRGEKMETHYQQLWDRALQYIQEKLSKPSYETWLKSTEAVDYRDQTLIIAAPNEFARDWLESRYSNLVRETLREVTGSVIGVQFVTHSSKANDDNDTISPTNEPGEMDDSPKTMLNPRYTFDTFVIGSGNRFAHAASLAVAEAPAKAYNPLLFTVASGWAKHT